MADVNPVTIDRNVYKKDQTEHTCRAAKAKLLSRRIVTIRRKQDISKSHDSAQDRDLGQAGQDISFDVRLGWKTVVHCLAG